MESLPPNSRTAKAGAPKPKKIEKVASANAKRRKKSVGRKFSETFVQGDARSAAGAVANNVIIPMIRDLMYEAGQTMMQKMIFGETRSQRNAPPSGLFGRVDYAGVSNPTRASRQSAPSGPAKARHSFDEMVLDSRQGAEEVIDRLMDILSQWEVVTIADLYALVGFEPSHTDFKWGWTDLSAAAVDRTRNGGYLLNLPKPKPVE